MFHKNLESKILKTCIENLLCNIKSLPFYLKYKTSTNILVSDVVFYFRICSSLCPYWSEIDYNEPPGICRYLVLCKLPPVELIAFERTNRYNLVFCYLEMGFHRPPHCKQNTFLPLKLDHEQWAPWWCTSSLKVLKVFGVDLVLIMKWRISFVKSVNFQQHMRKQAFFP